MLVKSLIEYKKNIPVLLSSKTRILRDNQGGSFHVMLRASFLLCLFLHFFLAWVLKIESKYVLQCLVFLLCCPRRQRF